MKCRYKHCKLGGEVEKEDAVKIGNMYYHKECRKEMDDKKEIERLYYEKFGLNEHVGQIRRAINNYVAEYDMDYILFVMNQSIKLNSIFGVSYYLRDKRLKDDFNKAKAKTIKFDIDKAKTEESREFTLNKKKTRKMWGDLI